MINPAQYDRLRAVARASLDQYVEGPIKEAKIDQLIIDYKKREEFSAEHELNDAKREQLKRLAAIKSTKRWLWTAVVALVVLNIALVVGALVTS